jgi:hypothetical protein
MTNSAPADESDATGPPVVARILLCVSVIICGLALRRCGLGLGLPAFFVKYGGSMLWGATVFFLVTIDILAYGVGIGLGIGLDRLAASISETPRLTPRAETARNDATPPRSGA